MEANMTYDPNGMDRREIPYEGPTGRGVWLAGLIAIVIIIGLVAWGTNSNTNVASNSGVSPSISGPETTGAAPSAPAKPAPAAPRETTGAAQ
jgi:hypothetical protein